MTGDPDKVDGVVEPPKTESQIRRMAAENATNQNEK